MAKLRRRTVLGGALALAATRGALAATPQAKSGPMPDKFVETPMLAERVARKELPPVAERLPRTPLVADLEAYGRAAGRHGGAIGTLISRARDVRYMSVISYARLVGYDEKLVLRPDILESLDNEGGEDRVFTMTLREGHRWSDGHPFTTEDFRYWWEDFANDKDLSPGGLSDFMLVEGEAPRFEILDERRVRFSWTKANPRFLPEIAGPRDPFLYRPAHYLKQFHAKYADKAKLDEAARKEKLKGWVQLHNRRDDMFENGNPAIPTLQPWKVMNSSPASRFVFERNPFYHRVDANGRQLPYVDRVMMDVSAAGLMAAKANAGETDLLFRGLNMDDVPILKEGERAKGYKTLLWQNARGSEIALYPNLNAADPEWRKLNRDVRYRRALSLAIDRKTLNNALLFGLGVEGNDTVMKESPLFRPEYLSRDAVYDPGEASRLLDGIGLTGRNGADIRLLPDGRELEVIVETDGESGMLVDALTLIAEFWREVGIKLFVKPQERTILRNRSYAGLTVMVAAQGLDRAMATAAMAPSELAPVRQDNYAWPKWGQYVETKGKSGEPCDLPAAQRLLELNAAWLRSSDEAEQAAIWREMLMNRAENQWVIGTVSGALQPVVVRDGLKNVPAKAMYAWDPTAMLGIYRVDEFWWDRAAGKEAAAAPAGRG
jgi:peptide/nickel transport system substrate-binding protein